METTNDLGYAEALGFTPKKTTWDPHLRSTHAVSGHHVEASDGSIGHVEDFIIDSETWTIRYLMVDTVNWWPGKKVLVSPRWIDHVSWEDSKVFATLSRDAIRSSPEYTKGAPLTQQYEADLHRHYDQEGYWVDSPENNPMEDQTEKVNPIKNEEENNG